MNRVYLVDDHAMMRDGLRAVLEAAGHRVVGESGDPIRALAEIQSLEAQVVLLDLQLGGHSGLMLLADMAHRRLAVITIVLTMSAQPRDVTSAFRHGAAGYLLKGSSAAELLDAIDRVSTGQRYLGQGVVALAIDPLGPHDDADIVDSLSMREQQILLLVARGHSSSEIGRLLNLSPKTVDSYRSRLMAKVGVANVPALVRFAIRAELIDANER